MDIVRQEETVQKKKGIREGEWEKERRENNKRIKR